MPGIITKKITGSKCKSFDELKTEFMKKTLSVEQDDVPKLLAKLLKENKNCIDKLPYKQSHYLRESDNWF